MSKRNEHHCEFFKAIVIASLNDAVCFTMNLFSFTNSKEKARLQKVLKKKQDERKAEIYKLRSTYKLDDTARAIVDLEWKELLEKLQSRELSATEVLHAYIAKAIEVNDKCNPITGFIPQAHIWAQELDALETVKGPFHGVPICIKEDHAVEGMDTVHGYVKQLYNPAEDSAAFVKVLQDLGCVPFAKTNVPQTLSSYGSDNLVFGKTLNALNPELSPGGSSSGTGALVGAHGCMFGTGSDIGGSLRIPAHFNGVSTLKPTGGRITDKGIVHSLPNIAGLTPLIGVIGINPTIVADVFQEIIKTGNQSSYDPLVVPIPWNESLFTNTEKLRIGYYTSMPYFPVMGDTEKIVLKAKTTLESLGHTLVPFEMPDAYKFMNTFGKIILADEGKHFTKCWKDEQVAKGATVVWLYSVIPTKLQRRLARLLQCKSLPCIYSPRTAVMVGSGAVSSAEVWSAYGSKKVLIDKMVDDWQELKLNCLLCPSFPFPAPDVDAPGLLFSATCYTAIWNLVDFPAGIVSFGIESGQKLDAYDDEDDFILKIAKKSLKNSTGAPIGVQIVGLPFQEEIVLRVMKELEGKY